jgi:hypothetical protein
MSRLYEEILEKAFGMGHSEREELLFLLLESLLESLAPPKVVTDHTHKWSAAGPESDLCGENHK